MLKSCDCETISSVGAYYHLHCQVAALQSVGNHAVVPGRVLEVIAEPADRAEPLVYFKGTFHALADPESASLGARSQLLASA